MAGPGPAARIAEAAAAFIAEGKVGGVSEDVRCRVMGTPFPLKLLDLVMLMEDATEAGVA